VLRKLLQTEISKLDAWMDGSEVPPLGAFLKAVDILSSAQPDRVHPISDPESRRWRLGLESDLLLASLERAMQRAQEMRASILSRTPTDAVVRKPASVLAFLRDGFEPNEGRALVEAALDATVRGTGADMGNIQLMSPEGLVIVAQRGFEREFLDFFACVKTEGSCGAASHRATRVVVSDVHSDPIFAGTTAEEVMELAHARACQSTPLFGASGEVIGVLSTHYERPRRPGPEELEVVGRIAERTAFWLNGGSI
jgi:GAF domain-containing protein